MDFETRLSVIRWGLSVSLPIFIFADYSALQAYLLRGHSPSAEYVQFGWNSWYLTLFSVILLVLSLNWLLYKLKKKLGAEKTVKRIAPFLFLPLFFTSFFRNYPFGNQNGFLSYYLLTALVTSVILHVYFAFYKEKDAN